MYTRLNEKYTALCAQFGVAVRVCTASEGQKYRIIDNDGILTLSINADAAMHFGYEKVLAWGIRDILLPRLVMETENLHLRRFSPEDRETCFSLLSNAEDCYMDCGRCFSEKNEAYYQRIELFIRRETQYAVTLKSSGEIIGTIHVFPDESRAVDAMEIGYHIARPYQRKGYAREMLTAILDLLQNHLLVDTISAGTLPKNQASIHLLTKLGFQPEGIRHHGAWHEGLDKPVDLQYFYRDRIVRR